MRSNWRGVIHFDKPIQVSFLKTEWHFCAGNKLIPVSLGVIFANQLEIELWWENALSYNFFRLSSFTLSQ